MYLPFVERSATGFLPTSATVVQNLSLGSVQMNHTKAHLDRDTAEHGYKDPGDALVWAFVLRGRVSVRQTRSSLDTDVGAMSVKHFRRLTSFRYTPDFSALSIRMDSEALGLSAGALDALSSMAFPVGDGLPKILWSMTAQALKSEKALSPAAGAAVAQSAIDLTTAFVDDFLGRLTPPEVSRRNLVVEALRHIDAYAGDACLTPELVADAVGVSLRVLQKAFQAEGRSISGSILDARLARAAALLAGPSNGTSIERVAERSGFGSPSSFSRAFRARFGSSPRDWRRQQQEERGRPAS